MCLTASLIGTQQRPSGFFSRVQRSKVWPIVIHVILAYDAHCCIECCESLASVRASGMGREQGGGGGHGKVGRGRCHVILKFL